MSPLRFSGCRFLLAAAVVFLVLAVPAAAHSGLGGSAVETRFTFPAWMVWAAGAAVVALSFAIVGGFLSREEHVHIEAAPRTDASPEGDGGLTWGRSLGVIVLALVVANAFRLGSDSIFPQTVVWLVVWGVIPILSYTIADVWPRVSPFAALRPLAAVARGARAPWPYPRRLGAWPAVVLLLLVTGLEVADSPFALEPAPLALLVFVYVFVTLLGMTLFGDAWLEHAEVLTRTFRWWQAVAPVTLDGGRWHWRGVTGALDRLPVRSLADVAFTIGILFGVNFDAFLATGLGEAAVAHYEAFGVPFPHYALLLSGYLLFFGVWLMAARGIRDAAESLTGIRPMASRFAASLLPIAAGYHVAHTLFTVIENSPRFLVAALDPLGFAGWPEAWLDIPASLAFPDAAVTPLGILQVGLILLGHVIAVVVAHRLAFGTFPSRIQAVKSEVPLTLVMVAYTWTGLWLLSGAHGGVA